MHIYIYTYIYMCVCVVILIYIYRYVADCNCRNKHLDCWGFPCQLPKGRTCDSPPATLASAATNSLESRYSNRLQMHEKSDWARQWTCILIIYIYTFVKEKNVSTHTHVCIYIYTYICTFFSVVALPQQQQTLHFFSNSDGSQKKMMRLNMLKP